jgi:HAD superfamily hydrolase (TIGR01509 family)
MHATATVLFDVDGTLVDSNYLHTLAWSRALRTHGEWAPMNAIHRLIGQGSGQLLTRLIGRDDDAIAAAWRSEYDRLIGEVVAFPGAADLLRDLSARGASAVLATSSPAAHLDRIVGLLGVADVIASATTADDVKRAKPDPDIFLTAMHHSGGDPRTTFVVGDSVWDVDAASAARLPCLAVESGGFSEAELRAAGAVEVYADVATLHARLGGSPLAELLDRASRG